MAIPRNSVTFLLLVAACTPAEVPRGAEARADAAATAESDAGVAGTAGMGGDVAVFDSGATMDTTPTVANTPGCAGLPSICGPDQDEPCCAGALVPGGTFNRSNNARYPATLSSFWLDRFEITVGRFRRFVEDYPANRPAVGAGKHPRIAGSGWKAGWNRSLPADQAAMRAYLKCNPKFATWTDRPGANENKPINCVNWYMTFAFCAWDGGRMVTDAEINYAAAGGNEQRKYPWGEAEPARDGKLAAWGCYFVGGTCRSVADIPAVGSAPGGNGRWGHADLAGSLWERTIDNGDENTRDRFVTPCNDCADISYGETGPFNTFHRGAGFWAETPSASHMMNATRGSHNAGPAGTDPEQGSGTIFGARCARDP